MRFVFTKRFQRDYQRLTSAVQARTDTALRQLEIDPAHPSLHTHKRKDEKQVWQARVTRSYRILFSMKGDTITLLSVIPHEK